MANQNDEPLLSTFLEYSGVRDQDLEEQVKKRREKSED
jgi:hypothetical protein